MSRLTGEADCLSCTVLDVALTAWIKEQWLLIQVRDPSARVEHEASTSKIGEDQLFYFQQRGIEAEEAVSLIIGGFCREVFDELPQEFASEVSGLMSLKLEGSVG